MNKEPGIVINVKAPTKKLILVSVKGLRKMAVQRKFINFVLLYPIEI